MTETVKAASVSGSAMTCAKLFRPTQIGVVRPSHWKSERERVPMIGTMTNSV
jgi:hypothetical protein